MKDRVPWKWTSHLLSYIFALYLSIVCSLVKRLHTMKFCVSCVRSTVSLVIVATVNLGVLNFASFETTFSRPYFVILKTDINGAVTQEHIPFATLGDYFLFCSLTNHLTFLFLNLKLVIFLIISYHCSRDTGPRTEIVSHIKFLEERWKFIASF